MRPLCAATDQWTAKLKPPTKTRCARVQRRGKVLRTRCVGVQRRGKVLRTRFARVQRVVQTRLHRLCACAEGSAKFSEPLFAVSVDRGGLRTKRVLPRGISQHGYVPAAGAQDLADKNRRARPRSRQTPKAPKLKRVGNRRALANRAPKAPKAPKEKRVVQRQAPNAPLSGVERDDWQPCNQRKGVSTDREGSSASRRSLSPLRHWGELPDD